MNLFSILKKVRNVAFFPCVFCLLGVMLVACGNTGTSTGSTGSGQTQSTASATCTATPNATQIAARAARGNASGKIQSVQGKSLVVTTTKNINVTVSIASTTRISQVKTVALSALKEGASASFQVKQDSSGNYTATVITVTNLTGQNSQTFPRGNGAFGGGRGGCGGGRFGQNGQGTGGQGQTGNSGSTNTRFVFGTIGQINGQHVTVTDAQGNDYTVAVDSSTRIIQTVSATANDLKTGLTVAVIGTPISKGSMTAQSITISPQGTFRTTGSTNS